MKKYNFKTLERINKRAAKKIYNSGVEVLFIPCRLNPENNFFNLGIWINKNMQGYYHFEFETIVNEFEWYNCRSDTGLYTAFYIKKA